MEKNNCILKKSISGLHEHEPEPKVWRRISERLQEYTIIDSIHKLPTLSPPDTIWKNIDARLSKAEMLDKLTQFDPPQHIWEDIEKAMDEGQSISKPSRYFRLTLWATGIAAIFIIGFFIINVISPSFSSIQITEEWVEEDTLLPANSLYDESETILLELSKTNQIVRKDPEFLELESELAFLDNSKAEVLAQMTPYDTNENLELLLTEIELERTDLIKQMLYKLI